MWSWTDWEDQAPQHPDLSLEANEDGYIPLECNGRIGKKKCRTKVRDGHEIKRIKGKAIERFVYCSLCGHEDWRKLGKMCG